MFEYITYSFTGIIGSSFLLGLRKFILKKRQRTSMPDNIYDPRYTRIPTDDCSDIV